MMSQILTITICFTAGLAIAYLFFRMKWKQAGVLLNLKLDKLLSSGTVKLSPAAASSGFNSGIESLSEKLDFLVKDEKKENTAKVATESPNGKVSELKTLLDNSRIVNELGSMLHRR